MFKNIFLIILNFTFFPLNAQVKNETGTVLGMVFYEDFYIDSSSNIEPVAFAKVSLWKNDKIVHSTFTNFDGEFKFNVAEGVYKITVDFMYYETYTLEEVTVLPDKQIDFIISLKKVLLRKLR